jgi:hypothetical protein
MKRVAAVRASGWWERATKAGATAEGVGGVDVGAAAGAAAAGGTLGVHRERLGCGASLLFSTLFSFFFHFSNYPTAVAIL